MGGAVEAFGVRPDIVTLAKAFGGGVPCGAIGATKELFGPVLRGEHDIAGTFNGNPLTMAAARATLLEVLTPDAYARLDSIDRALKDGIRPIIDRYRLPAAMQGSARRDRSPTRRARCVSTATRSGSTSGSPTSRG